MINIIKTNWKWTGNLSKRTKTEYIVIHHTATSSNSAEDIHKAHRNMGYTGIGYHFYICKNGNIYEGRPVDAVGAHCLGYNFTSIGVCFEGNFEQETPTDAQIKSGSQLIKHLLNSYSDVAVVEHKKLYATVCPGKNLDINKIFNYQEEKLMKEKTYNWTTACPEWSQPYVHKALELGILKGDGAGNLNLNDDKIWCLVVILRATGIMK